MYVGYKPTSSRHIKDTIYGCILRDAQREAQTKREKNRVNNFDGGLQIKRG